MDQASPIMDTNGPLFYYSCLEDIRGELICVRNETPFDSFSLSSKKDKENEYEKEAKKKLQQFSLPQKLVNPLVSSVKNPYTAETMFIYMKTNKLPIIVDEVLLPVSSK